jgi:ATP-dependent helicase HrpA
MSRRRPPSNARNAIAPPSVPNDQHKADAIHRALLAGLITQVGTKTDKHDYLGTRQLKFHIFPGSGLFKSKPKWLMAAEIVETTRLFARTCAPINSEWIEAIAPHLLSHAYDDPFWSANSARAMTNERVLLLGLPVVPRRVVPFAKVDVKGARNLFIHHALVEMDSPIRAPFMRHNHDLIARVHHQQDKLRRKDLLADATHTFAFFDRLIPAHVIDGPTFEKWRRHVEHTAPKALFLTLRDVTTTDIDLTDRNYPDFITVRNSRLDLSYKYDVGHDADGVTALIPIALLPQLHAGMFDRLIPGYLPEKLETLIRDLPRDKRVQFVPIPDTVKKVLPAVATSPKRLTVALAEALNQDPQLFDESALPKHLQMRFCVVDTSGKPLATGRDLADLRIRLGVRAQSLFEDLPPGPWKRDGLTRWEFDDLPDTVPVTVTGISLPAYVGLVDKAAPNSDPATHTVSLRLFESHDAMRAASRAGIRRLFMIQMASEIKYLRKSLPDFERAALLFKPYGTPEDLRDDILAASADLALTNPDPADVRTKDQFVHFASVGWKRLIEQANLVARAAADTLEQIQTARQFLARPIPELMIPSVRDVEDQLAHLVGKGFLSRTPPQWLPHLPRFAKAINRRLEKLFNAGAARDMENLKTIRDFFDQYKKRARSHTELKIEDENLVLYRWMLEELRVSMFAQEMKTSVPVSPVRLEKIWSQVRPGRS